MQLALTQDTRRPTDTAELAVAAGRAGFSHLGMVSGRIEADAPAVLGAAGVACHELLGLQVVADLDATRVAAARLAADAETVGAPWVLTTLGVGLDAAVRDTVAWCAACFAEAGTALAVEFSPLGPVATIADAREVLVAASPARAGMVVDSWNYCFGPCGWHDLQTVPLDAIAYVQFADALTPLGPIDIEEAMRRRALPGQGVLPLARFVGILRDRGWDGIVSMQVLSDELRQLRVDEATSLVYHAGAEYWS